MRLNTKPLLWVGGAKKELMSLPEVVQDMFGYALHLAQIGSRHDHAKALKGLGGVMEIVENFYGDTYRAIYTVKLGDAVYVLHCFQKKSHSGIKTPAPNMDMIKNRLQAAKAHIKGV